jgi:hypothetical protein
MASAKVMFLSLDIPDDDPLKPAKIFVSTAAPGFRIFEKADETDWESDFIWLVVINEEDGLDFKLRQTIDGKREVQALWKDQELDDTSKLRSYLQEDPLWDVFQLRATVLLQNRAETQIEALHDNQHPNREASVRDVPWRLAERLRSLELELLERAVASFEGQVRAPCLYPTSRPHSFRLMGSPANTTYRRRDFSSQTLFSSTLASLVEMRTRRLTLLEL